MESHSGSDAQMPEISNECENKDDVCYVTLPGGTLGTSHHYAGHNPNDDLKGLCEEVVTYIFTVAHLSLKDLSLLRDGTQSQMPIGFESNLAALGCALQKA